MPLLFKLCKPTFLKSPLVNHFTQLTNRLSTTQALGVFLGLYSGLCSAEIYQWTDEQGRVHFGDKRAAPKSAAILGQEQNAVTQDGLTFTFYPQADALLSKNSKKSQAPQGKATMLSTGYWTNQNSSLETKSLLQFEITELLAELNAKPHKHLASATLTLYANTQDKLYGQGITNRESPGHSTLRGDNAFYLKPSHNNWEEATVTWDNYYSPTHHTPGTIRKLPVISVPGSDGLPGKDFEIDVTELVASMVLTHQREVTLELSPQRTSPMAQVTFFSREAHNGKEPKLVIELR